MAWRRSMMMVPYKLLNLADIPAAYNNPPRCRISLYHVNELIHLLNPDIRIPWIFVNQIVLFKINLKSPLIPDLDIIADKISYLCTAAQKPEKLMDNSFNKNFLCSQQREPFGKVKSHLIAKNTPCTNACPVLFINPISQDMLQQIKILPHNI